jgi:ribosome maturation factor RimP
VIQILEYERGQVVNKVEKVVTELARPVVESAQCTLWDVEFVKEGGRSVLRIYIDNESGVSTEHCETVSRALDTLLDEADPIESSYVLEVSSAGLERRLKRDSDFVRFMGHSVAVRLYAPQNGAREFVGALSGYDGQRIELDGGALSFAMKDVALARLHVEWDDL